MLQWQLQLPPALVPLLLLLLLPRRGQQPEMAHRQAGTARLPHRQTSSAGAQRVLAMLPAQLEEEAPSVLPPVLLLQAPLLRPAPQLRQAAGAACLLLARCPCCLLTQQRRVAALPRERRWCQPQPAALRPLLHPRLLLQLQHALLHLQVLLIPRLLPPIAGAAAQ